MNIFKRKHKRSEWFEGLLWTENFLWPHGNQDNVFVEDLDGMEGYNILWRNRNYEKPWIVRTCSREFGAGVLDYLHHAHINNS